MTDTFDPNADPDSLAARCAELALEQLDRLRSVMEASDDPQKAGKDFFCEPFEIGISNFIIQRMAAYAVLKGYVTPERAGIKPTD